MISVSQTGEIKKPPIPSICLLNRKVNNNIILFRCFFSRERETNKKKLIVFFCSAIRIYENMERNHHRCKSNSRVCAFTFCYICLFSVLVLFFCAQASLFLSLVDCFRNGSSKYRHTHAHKTHYGRANLNK